MTKILTKLKTSKLSGISFLSVILVLGTVAPAFAANLNINDSVEAQITLSHDANWEFGVVSFGVPFGPFVAGATVAAGETTSFSGTYFVNSGGTPDPGSGIIYIVDPNTGQVSDIITASWSTQVIPIVFDIATINVSVTSSAKCSDLGELPTGFTGVVETGGAIAIQGLFRDLVTDAPVSIPSNLTIQFESGEECDIDVEKTWTFTDYNWDPICGNIDAGVTGFLNSAGECFSDAGFNTPLAFRPANIDNPSDEVLADTLPQDGDMKYLLFAQVKKEKFKNTNPGAFYALTTVEILEDLDTLTVWENYADCFEDQDLIKFVSRDPTRNVKIAVAAPNGDITELTERLYDELDLGVVFENNVDPDSVSAHVEITDDSELTAGSTVYILVKFKNDLRNDVVDDNIFDEMCDNREMVAADALVGADQSITANAQLRITNQP